MSVNWWFKPVRLNYSVLFSELAVASVFSAIAFLALSFGSQNSSALGDVRAGFGFVFLTYLIGRALRKALYPSLSSLAPRTIALDVLLSLAFTTVLSVLMGVTGVLFSSYLAQVLVASYVIFIGWALTRERGPDQSDSHVLSTTMVVAIAFIAGVGLMLGVLSRAAFPYPQMPGGDAWVHLAGEGWIVQNHGGPGPLLFGSAGLISLPYPNALQFTVAAYSLVLGTSLYDINRSAVFVLIPALGIATFLLAFQLSKNHYVSLGSSLLAMVTPGSDAVPGAQYLYPSVVAMLAFILLLTLAADSKYSSGPGQNASLILFGFLGLLYYYAALVAIPLLATSLYRRCRKTKEKTSYYVLVGILIFSVLISLSTPYLTSSAQLDPPLQVKTTILSTVYSPLLLQLLPIGLLFAFVSELKVIPSSLEVRWNRMDEDIWLDLRDVAFFVSFLLMIFFLPSFGGYRIEVFGRALVAILVAQLLGFTVHRVAIKNKDAPEGSPKYAPDIPAKARKLSVISRLTVIALVVLLCAPQFTTYVTKLPIYNNISPDEYSAAEWINLHTSIHDYILTDPSTGLIIRGLTLRNASTFFLLNGHAVSVFNRTLPSLIYRFMIAVNLTSSIEILRQMPVRAAYVLITTRTSGWVQLGMNSSFFAPWPFHPWPGNAKFESGPFLRLSQWGNVSIYRVTGLNTTL